MCMMGNSNHESGCRTYRPAARGSRQRCLEMGTSRRHGDIPSARLGDDGDLPDGTPQPDRFVSAKGHSSHDRRRHRGRQGRLPESRSDGLRQSLRHGLLLRRGLQRQSSLLHCRPRPLVGPFHAADQSLMPHPPPLNGNCIFRDPATQTGRRSVASFPSQCLSQAVGACSREDPAFSPRADSAP